jgi:hypothetical protein
MQEMVKFLQLNLNDIKKIKNLQELDKLINKLRIDVMKENIQINENAKNMFNNQNPQMNPIYRGNVGSSNPMLNMHYNNSFQNDFLPPKNHPQYSNYFSNPARQNFSEYVLQNNSYYHNKEIYNKNFKENISLCENKDAKEKFYALKEKNTKRFFQVVYMFKNK